ncbi:amidohydrolase family protein [Zobellia barbeyronii]|uniref:Amidohydrolase family protein n=1 Tax=Zobellia barbeyronii TaxID=2748009 RepID=A0ABS5WHG9_9FLAO|nr:amidohydrolase family protein [Zobellia barbeyronii]MBT2162858.1 amidohydrolase family protein [Zobellia barbeyronii]
MKKITLLFAALLLYTTAQSQEADKASPTYVVLKNATIIDAVSDTGKTGSLLIKDDRIETVSYDGATTSPEGAIVYDLKGKYIIPGLIDAHVHITHGTLKEAQNQLNTALKSGVTGVRDMGGDGRMLTLLKKNMKIGEDIGSDVFFSTIIAGPEFFASDPRPQEVAKGAKAGEVSWQKAITDTTDLRQAVAEAKGLGATAIKVYLNVDKNLFKKVATEAKRQNLKVWAHGVVPPTKPLDITNGGADVMSHAGSLLQYQMAKGEIKGRHDFESREKAAEWKAKLDAIKWDKNTPEVIQLFDAMKNNNSILDATLFVYYYFKEDIKNMSDEALGQVDAFRAVTIAYEQGVKIGAGSDHMISEDGTINLHTEIKLLTAAGLSNIDAIRAATIVNAEGLGQEKNIGTIEKGKIANLVILNTDPLENISNTQDIKYVFKRGVVVQ